MSHRPNERPVRPHTLDRRSEKAAQQAAISKPVKVQHMGKVDKKPRNY